MRRRHIGRGQPCIVRLNIAPHVQRVAYNQFRILLWLVPNHAHRRRIFGKVLQAHTMRWSGVGYCRLLINQSINKLTVISPHTRIDGIPVERETHHGQCRRAHRRIVEY